MRFALSSDQTMLRDAVRDALETACPPDRVRAAWSAPDQDLWRLLADQGVFALELPEELGGLDMGLVEACAIAVELGRCAFPGPALETLAALPVLAQAGHIDLVERVVAGDAWVTCGEPGMPVPHAEGAAMILEVGEQVQHWSAPTLTPVASLDGARPLCRVAGTREPISVDADLLRDRLSLMAAAASLGLAEWMLDTSVAYAKARTQFGKPIGAFQAVQHHLANALLALRFAQPTVHRAAWSMDQGQSESSIDVSCAKAMCGDASRTIAGIALQVHGAIGYTWECDLHLFHKRALALERAWGDPASHRSRVAHALDLPA